MNTPTTPPRAVDWDHLGQLARRWYAPLTERDGWVAALYLFVGMFSAIGFFCAVLTVGLTMFGLLFAGIGLLLVRPFLAFVDVMARAERQMAGWVGVTIEPRPVRPLTRLGLRGLADPERWRQIGFLLINIVLGLTIGNLGLLAYWLLPNAVSADPFAFGVFRIGSPAGFFALAVSALALGAAPRLAKFVARFKAQMTAWFLGVDQLAEAQQRVSVLSEQRHDILEAVANERRRIERNLHDGVQQQLVAIGLDLAMAEQQLAADPDKARGLIAGARAKVQGSIGELRQLGRGLHPAILEDRGIDAALSAVVANATIPVSVHVDPALDLPTDVAETVYFVASECVANILKHAQARVASVRVEKVAANVRISVHDDGRGGVDPAKGTGIAGIRARVHAVDGTLSISSPPGGPTTIIAEIPRLHRSAS